MHIWVIERVFDDGSVELERRWEITRADAKLSAENLKMWYPHHKYRIRKYVREEKP